MLQPDRLQRYAQQLLIDLSKACGDVPVELYIGGTIEGISLDRIHFGGFADIYRGTLSGRPVAIKRLHGLPGPSSVRACVTSPCSDLLM